MVLIFHGLLSPVGHLQWVLVFIMVISRCTYFTAFFVFLLAYLFCWGVFCKKDSVVKRPCTVLYSLLILPECSSGSQTLPGPH